MDSGSFNDPYILFGLPAKLLGPGIYRSAGSLYLVQEVAQALAGLIGAGVNDWLPRLAIIRMEQSAPCIPVSLPGGSTFSNLYLTHTFYYVKMVLCYCFPANLLNLTCSICSSWQESSGSY
jgi:hypothetical protein